MAITSGFTGANTTRTNGVLFIGDALNLGANQIASAETIVIQGNGAIRANDSISGNEVILRDCSIFIDGLTADYSTLTSRFSYASASERRGAASAADLTFDRCLLVQRESAGSGSRRHYFISNLYDTTIVCEGNKTIFLVTEIGAKIKNLYLKKCDSLQPSGSFSYCLGLTLDATLMEMANFGRLDTDGLTLINQTSPYPLALTGGQGVLNSMYLWNKGSGVDVTKLKIVNASRTGAGYGLGAGYDGNYFFEGYTASWQFVNQTDSAPVSGVKLCYYDDIDNIYTYTGTLAKRAEYVTNAAGKLVGTWDSRTRTTGASQVRDALFLLANRTNATGANITGTVYTNNGASHCLRPTAKQIAVKSYLHQVNPAFVQGTAYEITSKIGAVNELFAASTYQPFFLALDTSISQANQAAVDAYATLDSAAQLYDRAKSAWYANESYPLVVRSGNTIDLGNYNLVINASASAAYTFSGNTITIKSSQFTGNLTTTGTITLSNGAEVLGSFTDSSSTRYRVAWSVTGILSGSRLQIYNLTKSQEIANQVVAGNSATGTYTQAQVSIGDAIRLRLTQQSGVAASLPFEATVPATAAGVNFLAAQVADPIYNGNAINGASITTISSDFPNVQLDVSDPDGLADVREIYARYVYALTTEQGVREWFGGIRAVNPLNFEVDAGILNLTIQNVGSTPVRLTGARIYRSDGQIILAASPGDQPLLQDTGELVQYIAPQIDLAISNNTTIGKISANSGLIPALL
jgi:hypothetical protein